MRDPRLRNFCITLSCGCRIYTSMRPHRQQSRYACQSNQGHSLNQPWASYQYRGQERICENPLLAIPS